MELFANIIDCIQPSTFFAKHSKLDIPQGKCASDKSKQKLGTLSFFSQKNRTTISAEFFYF